MSLRCQVLFDTPQREIVSLIRDRLSRCRSFSLVAGFVTVEGVEAIAPPIRATPSKLQSIVVGSGTYRAFQAFDNLIASGIPPDRLFVHLGHTRSTKVGAKHSFYRYHPMLHSKVYLMDMVDGMASAFIGSHNLTGFALHGLNGEASVLIEGPENDPELAAVRRHVDQSKTQSINYTPAMKEAFSWWTVQFIDGLRGKANDQPRDGETKSTIVIMTNLADGSLPKNDDVIYFEIPSVLGTIQSLKAEVHIYGFANLPPNPLEALSRLDEAKASLWCQTKGLEIEQGGVELRADWYLEDKVNPELKRAPKPFRPAPSPGMQQVRVKVWNQIFDRYEYLFHVEKAAWEPVFEEVSEIRVPPQDQEFLKSLNLVPPEDKEWFLVKDLRPAAPSGTEAYRKALEDLSPKAGGFILISLRRRKVYDKIQNSTGEA